MLLKDGALILASTIVGNALRTARNNIQLSVVTVINRLLDDYQIQVSAKTLYGWEAGRSQPDIDTFISLCQIYNISILEFTKLGQDITFASCDKTVLDVSEYPVIVKYRRLNDSGKDYIDSQLDYAFTQEKYKLKKETEPADQSNAG